MSLDFQQVQKQVKQMGENAQERESQMLLRRDVAERILRDWAERQDELRERIALITDDKLRTAAPSQEALDTCRPAPAGPFKGTLLAADGSQIFPDRNAPVDFSLINVGAVELKLETGEAPKIYRQCTLLYGEELAPSGSIISETRLSLMRDFAERKKLADLALSCEAPVITFSDGPLELFMSGNANPSEQSEFDKKRSEYMQVLEALYQRQIVTAGYVDKPGADYVIRMLEIATASPEELYQIRDFRPLQGVRDRNFIQSMLAPGERSAVFALRFYGVKDYPAEIAPHFFYLNVGREKKPWIARVEFPAWVAENTDTLDSLHAAILQQCRVMGARPYPYLLHRAHETAMVSMQEKDEVLLMITAELTRKGVQTGSESYKQAAKDLGNRTRYKG